MNTDPRALPVVLAMLLLPMALCATARSAEPSLLSRAGAEEKDLYSKAQALILAEAAKPPLLLSKSNESYFWVMSARLAPLMQAHQYSKDPKLLEAFVPLMEQVLGQRYVHPTRSEWSGWFEYDAGSEVNFRHLALIDHDTILYYVPVLLFVQEVRADAALKARYGQKAEAWMKDVEASIRAWDRRGCWHELGARGGWYTIVTQYPDPGTGELKNLESIYAGGAVPYNKVHAFTEALSLADRLTGDPWYRQRMEKCATYFRSRWRADDKHAEWNYRDHAFPGDYKSGVVGQGETRTGAFVHPKGGYYALDAAGVVTCYGHGVFYQKADIDKLLQTNLEFMFLGDEKDPKFRMVNGQYSQTDRYNKGTLWTALAHFSPKVRQLWKTQLQAAQKANRWMWWGTAVEYLLETAQPVSYEPRHVRPAPKTAP